MVTKNAKAEKPKRKMLTPAERVAKAEADLAALREKATARASKAASQLREHRAKLVAQIVERDEKIEAIDDELHALGVNDEDVELPLDDEDVELPLDDGSQPS